MKYINDGRIERLSEIDIRYMARLNFNFAHPKTQFTKELYEKWLNGEKVYFTNSCGEEEMIDKDLIHFPRYILKKDRFYTK